MVLDFGMQTSCKAWVSRETVNCKDQLPLLYYLTALGNSRQSCRNDKLQVGYCCKQEQSQMAGYKQKQAHLLALQCALYKYTEGTHLGSFQFVVYEQQPWGTSAPASTS